MVRFTDWIIYVFQDSMLFNMNNKSPLQIVISIWALKLTPGILHESDNSSAIVK